MYLNSSFQNRRVYCWLGLGLVGLLIFGCSDSAVDPDDRGDATNASETAASGTAGTGTASSIRAANAVADGHVLAYSPPETGGYLGDTACMECHTEVCDSYAMHPMSRSIEPVDIAAEQSLAGGEAVEIGNGNHHYLVTIDQDQLRHSERMLGPDGEVLFDQGEAIDYTVGSGRKAKAYLIQHDGLLFMSPVNFYSEDSVFDFAPGHTLKDARRFNRRAMDDCISCHAGVTNVETRNSSRFEREPFMQAAIGCESCHGPGQDHVDYQMAYGDEREQLGEDPIVRIGSLDFHKREAVCYQCHLLSDGRILRPGRSHFDFRPGDRLDDIWIHLVKELGSDAPSHSLANVDQVQQMHASVCFQESAGRMGCTTCHDPHAVPESTSVGQYFRDKCLTCHEEASCRETQASRVAVSDHCVTCHMPQGTGRKVAHASQTDHRILKSYKKSAASQEQGSRPVGPVALRSFWQPQDSIPDWELQRALAMGDWLVNARPGSAPPTSIAKSLRPIAAEHPEDGDVSSLLGAYYLQYEQPARAIPYLRKAAEQAGTRENALSNLLTAYYTLSRWEPALECADELLTWDADSARVRSLRADILYNLGRENAAIEDAEKALELNPKMQPVRAWLIDKYMRRDDRAAAQPHIDFYERFESITKP